MAGNIHAIVLIVVVVVTVCLCLQHRNRKPSRKQVASGIVTGALLSLLAALVATHSCWNGQPVTQWLIPGLCVVATLILVDKKRLRRVWTTVLSIVMFIFSLSYSALVHTSSYLGEPAYDEQMADHETAACVYYARQILEQAAPDDTTNYSQGWIADSNLLNSGHLSELRPLLFHEVSTHQVSSFWHTWLTGLYKVQTVGCELWYPGGKIGDAVHGIEYRVREPR